MELSNILTVAAIVLSAIGLLMVAWQIKESEKSRQLQATVVIFDSLDSDESRALRRFVYNDLPQNIAVLSDEMIERVEKICADFEKIAVLANRKLVNKDLIFAMHVGTFILCWERLEFFY